MYVPICELRRRSTMLPLRSRTSWRLRALTVTCLPRDWTWAGVYHFANNRRPGHDLPEGHHGELVEQVWATRHTRQSLGSSGPPGRGRVIRTLRPFRSGRTLGRGTVTSLDQLDGIPAAEVRAPPRSATAAMEPSASPAPAHHQPPSAPARQV